MNTTLLVWLLFNVGSGKMALPYYFNTQSDCLRAGMVMENNVKTRGYYTCEKLNIANPYEVPVKPTPAPADLQRAMRNYQSEQDQINRLLNGQ
jgi:hypothetical protein